MQKKRLRNRGRSEKISDMKNEPSQKKPRYYAFGYLISEY